MFNLQKAVLTLDTISRFAEEDPGKLRVLCIGVLRRPCELGRVLHSIACGHVEWPLRVGFVPLQVYSGHRPGRGPGRRSGRGPGRAASPA